jgi:peptide/nickel transport system substrate-binding protein
MTISKIRLTALTATLMATALGVSACGSGGSSASGTPAKGGTLRIVGQGDIDFLDPTAGYNTDTHTLARAWTRQLFTYPASKEMAVVSKAVPDVATDIPTEANGGITDGGKTYTLHIREGVMWNSSPARQVTADDFVRSFKRMCNPVAPVGAPGYFTSTILGMAAYCAEESKIPGTAAALASFMNSHDLAGVQAPNPKTLVFHLTQPTSDFIDIIAEPFASAVPVEYLKYVPNSPEFVNHVMSDGPYEITKYEPGQEIDLQRNPAWKASVDPVRKAYVDNITITQGVTPEAVQQQIQAGTADMPWDVTVPTPDIPGLAGDPNLTRNPSGQVLYSVFNEQSPNNSGALKNVKVRQALEYAVDKTSVSRILGGAKIAEPVSQILTPLDIGYKAFNLYPTDGSQGDPAKAKQLLAAAGYGSGLTLKFVYAKDTGAYPQIAQSIQSDLQAAGVTVQMIPATRSDVYGRYLANPANGKTGAWDVSLLSWTPDWFGNNGRSTLQPMTDGANYGPNSVDYGDYDNTVVNKLIDKASSLSASQTAEVADTWSQVSLQSMKDAAFIPLVSQNLPLYTSSRVHNAVFLPINGNFDITNIWLSGGGK